MSSLSLWHPYTFVHSPIDLPLRWNPSTRHRRYRQCGQLSNETPSVLVRILRSIQRTPYVRRLDYILDIRRARRCTQDRLCTLCAAQRVGLTTRWQAGASSFDNHSRTGARVPQDVVLVFADFINGLMILVGSGCKDVPRVQIYDARSLSKEEDRREDRRERESGDAR